MTDAAETDVDEGGAGDVVDEQASANGAGAASPDEPARAGRLAAFTALGAALGAAAGAAKAIRARRGGEDEAGQDEEPERPADEPSAAAGEPAGQDRDADEQPEDEPPEPRDEAEDAGAGEGEEPGEPQAEPADEQQPDEEEDAGPAPEAAAPEERHREAGPALRAARQAREQLPELTGRPVESVAGVERTEEGWHVLLEVLELSRIPPTTDVLALYLVELDGDGDVVAYERTRRYLRSQGEGSDG